MKLRNIFTLAALCLSTSVACAQMALPKTQIGGVEFYRYDTSAGESIYDIAAKLGVTKDYIIQNNPRPRPQPQLPLTLLNKGKHYMVWPRNTV